MICPEFSMNRSSLKDILDHLSLCSNNFSPPLHTYVDLDEYASKLFSKSEKFEAWVKDKLIGLIAVYLNDPKKETGFVTNVSVISEFQGTGLASRMLDNVIKYAVQECYQCLTLEVGQDNLIAKKLYNKKGFHIYQVGKNGKIKMKWRNE